MQYVNVLNYAGVDEKTGLRGVTRWVDVFQVSLWALIPAGRLRRLADT
tara:strand:- start:155 stop:298 length:144 start_codon:yes stop_codon:yes gene_type:complete